MYLIIQNYPKIPALQPKKHNQTSLEPFLLPIGLNSRQTHAGIRKVARSKNSSVSGGISQ
jgi:hypothetical protein